MTKPFKTIGVVGAGTMGLGIAQVIAQAGLKTVLYESNADVLAQAETRLQQAIQAGIDKGKYSQDTLSTIRQNLTFSAKLDPLAQVDLVIEAIPEQMTLKQALLTQLDALCPPETCFASNTSSLSISALAAATKRPTKVAGMHFFNPVPQMKLVEIIHTGATDPALLQSLTALAKTLGKTPVLAKDTPGFIVNRVARSFYGESLRLLDEGVADVETLDTILQSEGGFAMGPFRLMDLIGLDINYAVSQSVYEAFFQEPRFQPHPIQRQLVEAGHLGRKTGQGFYTYE